MLYQGNGDCVLQRNKHIREDWIKKDTGVEYVDSPAEVPPDVVTQLESYDPIRQTKRAKDLVVMDGLICTKMPDGSPAVLFSIRAPGAFGGKLWGYGGTLGCYQDPIAFLEGCVEKESGVPFTAEVWIGNFRTCAPEFAQSTANYCYAGFVPYEIVQEKKKKSAGHHEPHLHTFNDLAGIPQAQRHWFPARTAILALSNMP